MSDGNPAGQAAQINAIMVKLRPQLPKAREGRAISEDLINHVQDVLQRNRDEIIAIAAVAGGLTVLIPALTVATVAAVGFAAEGVAAGSLAEALQSSVYGDLTTGVLSVLQSFDEAKEGETFLKRHRNEIVAAVAVAGGLTVLVPTLAVAAVAGVGFTAEGVAAGSLAAAIQSSVYGGFTGGVFSLFQSFGATATMASPLANAAAGVATVLGGKYLARREGEGGEEPPLTPDLAEEQTKNTTSYGGKQPPAAGDGAALAAEEVGESVVAATEQAGSSEGAGAVTKKALEDGSDAAHEADGGKGSFFKVA